MLLTRYMTVKKMCDGNAVGTSEATVVKILSIRSQQQNIKTIF